MFKNTAAKFMVFAFDATTNLPKTGDAAQITCYVSKDYGSVTVLADTSATEMDATNGKGYYLFDAAQGETNADCLMISAKSSTSNIVVVGAPAVIYTRPTTNFLAPVTLNRTLVVDASGLADANTVKIGPTGSGTAQTARDIGASVLLSTGTGTGQLDFTSGIAKVDVNTIKTQAVTCAAGVTVLASVGTAATSTAQTGDNFARLGAPAGASHAADTAAVKTDTAAVKVQTDKLTFTVSNQVDANALSLATTLRAGIRKNVALAKFEFLMTDSTNHNPATGLTCAVTRSIDGGAFAAGTLSAVTEVSAGVYYVDFGAGDLNGEVVTLRVTATASDDLLVTIVTDP